jgi:sigma-E factor negative regulatory protein RseB
VSVIVLLLAGAVAVGGVMIDAGGASEPLDVLERARRRTADHDYEGTIAVRWRDAANDEHSYRTRVEYHDGVARFGDDGVAASPEQLVLGEVAWSTSAGAHMRGAPSATDKYEITERAGQPVAGRTTIVVEARRRSDGALVERFHIDDDNGLVLQRDSFDGDATPRRSVEFERMWSSPRGAATDDAADDTATRAAHAADHPELVDDVDTPYRAPERAGDGYRLVGRWEHDDAIVQLSYSDGLLSASVFEQKGKLDWDALPTGGVPAAVGGGRAVAYSLPVGEAVVWQRGGLVYTCVGDAPRADLVALAGDVSRRGRTGALTRLARVVLAPFGW